MVPLKSILPLGFGLAFGVTALTSALAQSGSAIPDFGSKDFGWQTNVEDWQDPPADSGHGPMREDPAYPFISNAEGGRTGRQPNNRITNTKDPILKPWAAAE